MRVGAQRTGHGFNREQDQTLNQLLVELDGFEGAEQVVVIGASNRIQDLDPALLRPGRFDRQMLVAPPDLSGREAIVGGRTPAKPLGPDVDLRVVARQTSGLTGAELANICNEATIFAGRRGDQELTHADFDAALERVVAGLQQRKVLTKKERRILAYHESGHALMAHRMGSVMELQKVTIVSRGTALGYAFYLPEETATCTPRKSWSDRMIIALAGRAAEKSRRPGHQRRRRRSREGDRERSRDGVRVGHGRQRLLADDARRQLRPLRGDEAAARPRAGAAHRLRLPGGAAPA
jgi:cell division protease FtsH